MVSVTVEENVINILQNFIDDKIDNPINLLENFSDEDFKFSIKFEKYEASLNASAAQVIVDFQDTIHRIAALCRYGKQDIRLLSDEEKQKLEIPFKIYHGSTVGETDDLLKATKYLLKMASENRGKLALAAISAVMTVNLYFTEYLDYKLEVNRLEVQAEETRLEIEERNLLTEERVLQSEERILQAEERKFLYQMVREKISEEYADLGKVIDEHDKNQLENMTKTDNGVELNKQRFTAYQLAQIKKSKNEKPKIADDTASHIVGFYYITRIDIENDKLRIKNIKTGKKIDVFYDRKRNLFSLDEMKEKIHLAIDKEDSVFIIEFSISKNDKAGKRKLISIKEQK